MVAGTHDSDRSAWLAAAGVVGASFIGFAALALAPAMDGGPVAAVFPPWWSEAEAIGAVAAGEASLIRTTAFQSILVVSPAAGLDALRRAGAVSFINPRVLSACLGTKEI